jgi:hypothetical protein
MNGFSLSGDYGWLAWLLHGALLARQERPS